MGERRLDRVQARLVTRRLSRSIYGDILKKEAGRGREACLSLFLDFDGTLTPIAGHPDDATLEPKVREILQALKERYPVAIISGRGLKDLKEKVSIEGLTYVGNHGMEVFAPDFSFVYDIGRTETLEMDRVANTLHPLSLDYGGTVLERKGLTLSIHYRLVQGLARKAFLHKLSALLKPFVCRGLIKITGGKEVLEVRPTADWDKGSALGWLMERRAFRETIPLCIGDDETDEDAFKAIEGSGVSVFVGRRKSSADFYLARQREVEPFLAFLAEKGLAR